jgi:hypothetical protein
MAPSAPLRVPVELMRDGARWFRLAFEVSHEGLQLTASVPDQLDGPLALAFYLPGDERPVRCHGRAAEAVVGEGEDEQAERRRIVFLDLGGEARLRIDGYVAERIGPA